MKKITLNLIMIACAVFSLTAQNTNKQKADNYLDTKGEVCFTFQANSSEQFKEISRFLSIGHGHVDKNNLTAEAYANKKTFAEFLKYGLPYQVNKGDNELLFDAHKSGTSKEAVLAKSKNAKMMAAWDTTWDAYPTYSQYVAKMNAYVSAYPALCSLQTIGTTANGRALLVLKISDNVATEEAEPEFLYTSSMHGNEITGYPLMIHLIDYLLSNYGTDTEVTDIVNSTEIYINPSANPDGTYGSPGNNTITSPVRANSNGQDLNRNYPDNVAGIHYDGTYENETLAFMAFANSRDFVLSANFHDGTEVVNYPYDNTFTKHADHDFYEFISNEYAVNAQNDSPNNYYNGVSGRGAAGVSSHPNYMTVEYDDPENPSSPGVTQGVIWYQVYGGRQDYSNYYQHSKEVTVELAFEKFITPSELPMLWAFNKQAFLDYLKQVNNGFQGTVKDESGNPIVAQISITGHDKLNSYVFSNPDHGDYYKLIKGGTYTVTYSAPGYISQDISVTAVDDIKTTQNVTLVATTANPTASDDQLCDSGTTTLNATGTGTLNWYDDENATASIFSGASFTTPTLTSTTSYFVEDVVSKSNVGNTSSNSNGGNFTSSQRYLIFDCSESVTLEQVTINANSAGDIEVELQDSAGNVLDATVVSLSTGGVQAIDLNFKIPVANNLRLVGKDFSTGGLYRNNSGVSFPYNNGSISIKDSSAGTGFYYFFYDWKIGSIKSARKEVVVIVDPSPSADFTYVVNPANNGEVTFTNTSSDATSYAWDFNDSLGTSTSTSPTYTYLSSGTYDVELTSTNTECGDNIKTISVTVNIGTLGFDENELSGTTVYPNPFKNNIAIKLKEYDKNADLDILLIDINGRTIYNQTRSSNKKVITISNLSKLQQGLYFLKITNKENGENTVRQLVRK